MPRSCLVTDRRLAGTAWREALPALAGRAGEAGVDLVQVREPGLDARDLAALVGACRRALAGSATRLLVNDRLDVALGEGADGVHLPGYGLAAADVRRCTPAGFVIGRSVHESDRDMTVVEGADFVIFGTVFASASKPGRPAAGLEALARAAAATSLPVLAIGGVDEARLAAVARTGAAGVAAIRWLAVPSVEELRRRVRLVAGAFDTLGRLP
ncbi:MAG: thiamine phosphate synthase [Vicinamibacterales bacterium]